MLSTFDVREFLRNNEKKLGSEAMFRLSEDQNFVLDNKTGEQLCGIPELTQLLRKNLHCDFEPIWSCHASLDEVYRCRECGTVIFGGDDELRYDPDERCPVCCHDPSVCHNEYWTAEEIRQDEEKQKTVAFYEQMAKTEKAAEARRKARGGLYDWERWIKKIRIGRFHFTFKHVCFGDGMGGWKKDRYLSVSCAVKDSRESDHCFGWKNAFSIDIPLNFYAFYLRFIYPYSAKCSPEVRRCHFWQKAA